MAQMREVDPSVATSGLPPGYAENWTRGTAFFFTEVALERWLRDNHLSHVIRAHEAVMVSYEHLSSMRSSTTDP